MGGAARGQEAGTAVGDRLPAVKHQLSDGLQEPTYKRSTRFYRGNKHNLNCCNLNEDKDRRSAVKHQLLNDLPATSEAINTACIVWIKTTGSLSCGGEKVGLSWALKK